MTKTILIVDDNAFIRQALCELFEREGDFEVCGEVEDGRQAIAAATCLHPDLVVLDISMPVMNGLDAARVLKALMPALPLILYSVGVDRAVESQARSIGVSDVVSKAAPVSVLISKARHLLYSPAAWIAGVDRMRCSNETQIDARYAERLQTELSDLLRKQREVLDSRMLGTASDSEVLEYEIRQELIHEICNQLVSTISR
jgi:two-component system, chemotaxis family, chemotaxis protein CheY